MEEQRQQFKLKTQNLLKFHEEEVAAPKGGRPGRKKKEKTGDIFSEGEEGDTSQQAPKKKRFVARNVVCL